MSGSAFTFTLLILGLCAAMIVMHEPRPSYPISGIKTLQNHQSLGVHPDPDRIHQHCGRVVGAADQLSLWTLVEATGGTVRFVWLI
ncbi:hypothetical protein [Herbiconiux sp. VKM Ac-2851]|uniref:hypothetical protein n=1 Tax=Herbiconiux sp. VKM Ac-2851 TaxID=2739025 RepID=UPI001566D6AE|nr:hypothetical protein [Herbiconiux sp. VKM Ac-2851]NQX35547.1 hypothetical protein [Herbiconiux sp. VKM Ac-2851]